MLKSDDRKSGFLEVLLSVGGLARELHEHGSFRRETTVITMDALR